MNLFTISSNVSKETPYFILKSNATLTKNCEKYTIFIAVKKALYNIGYPNYWSLNTYNFDYISGSYIFEFKSSEEQLQHFLKSAPIIKLYNELIIKNIIE